MSAIELAIQQVKGLSEPQAQLLLAWLRGLEGAPSAAQTAPNTNAARGFARRYRAVPRPTAEWMKELREGEA